MVVTVVLVTVVEGLTSSGQPGGVGVSQGPNGKVPAPSVLPEPQLPLPPPRKTAKKSPEKPPPAGSGLLPFPVSTLSM